MKSLKCFITVTKDNINLELLLALNETLSMYFIVNSKYLPLQKVYFGEYTTTASSPLNAAATRLSSIHLSVEAADI